MALHKDLTGADLHEPKGITGAATGYVYVSNGGGSGTWKKVGTNEIDKSGLGVLSTRTQTFLHPNIRLAGKSAYATVQVPGTLTKVAAIIDGTMTEDITITLTKNGSVALGSFLLPTGSPEGGQASVNITPNVSFSVGDSIKAQATGGASGALVITLNMELIFSI